MGLESREIIDRAALEDIGHLAPNSTLTPEQTTLLRTALASPAGRGSLFSGGAAAVGPSTSTSPPPASGASPPPENAFDPTAQPNSWSQTPAGASDSPTAPLSGGDLGQPLGFSPPTGAPTPPPSPPPQRPPASTNPTPSTPPLWEPLSFGDSPPLEPPASFRHDPTEAPRKTDYSGSGYSDGSSYIDYTPQIEAPKTGASSGRSRSVVVGVLGIILIVFAGVIVPRQLGLTGPKAERNCLLTVTPVTNGEGTTEELVCVDGNGKEVRREVRNVAPADGGLEFGRNADDEITRIVDLDEFCRGAKNFQEFHDGFVAALDTSTSMAELGAWYDSNDGFGSGGLGTMMGTFGNAGVNEDLVSLSAYLDEVEQAARSSSLDAARMIGVGAENTYGQKVVSVRNFRANNC